MKGTFAIVLGLVMIAVSCEPSQEAANNLRGAEYFPLTVGSFLLYNVDSTHIHLNTESKFSFQLRVTVSGSYQNSGGNTTYVLQREKRANASEDWTAAGTWSAWVDARNAVMVEGNDRFIRLQFPIAKGNQWNGNAMNSNGGGDFCGDQACDLYTVSGVDPDVVVVQSDEKDILVKYDVRTETYRKDIGLVNKEMTVLEYCTTQDCFGKQFVNVGIRYKQTLIDGQI